MATRGGRVFALLPWLFVVLAPPVFAAVDLPETSLSYDIEVTLDPESRRLYGRETVRWTNPSASKTVTSIPLHLYLNAFAHEQTTWMRTTLGRMVSVEDILDLHDDPWGWNEPRSILQGSAELDWHPIAPDDGNPFDRSLIEVRLDTPVGPGETLELEIEFDARLPVPFARTGGFGGFFMVAQWFPKLAVFEQAGVRGAPEDRWNAHQFHGRTEFYAEFADFDVRIGVPEGWTVAATGRGGPGDGKEEGTAWHRYRQRAVHDFSFATGSSMVDLVSDYRPAGRDEPLEIHVYVPSHSEAQADRWRRAVEGSLDTMGARVGPYPYDTITVVMPPFHVMETWGMEYPTLFTGLAADPMWDRWPFEGLLFNELVIAHEFCHQYFYGLLATNEFEEAFLDEGFTEFWGNECIRDTYGDDASTLFGRPLSLAQMGRLQAPRPGTRLPPLRTRPTFLVRGYNFGQQFYARPSVILRTLEGLHGRDTLDAVFAAYYQRWAFGHPTLEEFLETARDTAGDEVADFLDEAYSNPRAVDYRVAFFKSETWSSPKGRLVGGEDVTEREQAGREAAGPEQNGDEAADPEQSGDGAIDPSGLDPAAREADGLLTVEILDPGTMAGDRWGRIERRALSPERSDPEEDWEPEEDEYFLSEVRLEGPGWDHLPVEVRFRFADGAIFEERWDGRSPYRSYRFVRPAPLVEVSVDPRGLIALDGNPVNNSRLREPDSELAADWSAWLAGMFQLLTEAMAQWL